MLRCFQTIKHLNHRHALLVNLKPRNYHYQTEFYTNKFETFDQSLTDRLKSVNQSRNRQSNLYRFIHAYRQYGFKIAQLDPLNQQNNCSLFLELDPSTYGLEKDSTRYAIQNLIHASDSEQLTITEIEDYLKKKYSEKISIEFDFITNPEEKLWIEQKFEEHLSKPIENNIRLALLNILMKSQVRKNILVKKNELSFKKRRSITFWQRNFLRSNDILSKEASQQWLFIIQFFLV